MVTKKLRNTKSQKIWSIAKKIIPGGNMLLSKKPEMFLPDYWPTYFSKSKGCYVWDLNNKKYTDVSLMGVGTNILGYNNKYVDKKVKEAIKKGNMTTLNCPEEVELAQKLLKINKWSGMVKFARTGGEAAAIAIRIARAYNKKNIILACGYHGWHDWYLASNISNKKNLNSHLLNNTLFEGVPDNLKNSIKLFEYNSLVKFRELIKKEKNVSAVIMEVSRNYHPSQNYLKQIRKMTKENNIVLIFDECTSGFREFYGGIHKKFKINPDIILFGKALGNGYPVTAIVGVKKIMQKAQDTFISSTFWTERIGSVAALATLKEMKKISSWKKISKKGKYIKNSWKIIFKKYNFDVEILGIDALPVFRFKNGNHLKFKTYITQEMLKKGYLASNAIYVSVAHSEKILKKYLSDFEKVIEKLSKFHFSKKIKLDGKICHSEMKRIN